jgi:hypothetical protein
MTLNPIPKFENTKKNPIKIIIIILVLLGIIKKVLTWLNKAKKV